MPTMNAVTSAVLAGLGVATLMTALPDDKQGKKVEPVQLGNFSVSLTVKDIKASKAFYEKLDFKQVAGKLEQNWVVLQNGTTKIGLFQGMFEKNSLTFNPGWDSDRKTPKDFQDVRELQRILMERGVKLDKEADAASDGPAFFTLADPDGNPILVDQHVPKPKR
jgi:catechol 2,3-dioxygenase-like lactoylglutathione lyase family enzyme